MERLSRLRQRGTFVMSKFQNILDAANKPQDKDAVQRKVKAVKKSSPPTANEKSQPIKKGRPKGKRSNPDFEQVTSLRSF